MEIEEVTNPAPETVAEVTTPETPPSQEAQQPDPQSEEGQAPATEFEEVEIDGNKYSLPKEIADKFMMNRDYTQKTQAVAEERRAVIAERESFQRERQIEEALFTERANLSNVEARLEAYRNTNWQAWQSQDPNSAQAAMADYMMLRDAHTTLSENIKKGKEQLLQEQYQRHAEAQQSAISYLSKPRPEIGWDGKFDNDRGKALVSFGRQIGIPDAELMKINNPALVQALNLAKIGYDALMKQRQQPTRPEAVTAAKVPTSRSTHTSDPRKMSMEQYAKARKEGRIS